MQTATNLSARPSTRRPLLTIDDVAETMNLQPKTIRAWVLRREIPFVRVGHKIRFRPEVIEDFIASGEVRARQRRRVKSLNAYSHGEAR